MERMIGVIGGSGVYEIDGLKDGKWVKIDTPWGSPSDEIFTGTLDGMKMAFLPRHGAAMFIRQLTFPTAPISMR